jgi:ArsR family transcriptional regulator, arsenate/arsenite/antimonite-responsive transcriptional repressor
MEIKQAVIALTALSQETRLRIFRLLVPVGELGVAAGEIAERLEIPPATLTFHLKELAHAGLVESRREGRSIIYSLRAKGMQELLMFLAKDCCQGQPELCFQLACKPKKKGKLSPLHRRSTAK